MYNLGKILSPAQSVLILMYGLRNPEDTLRKDWNTDNAQNRASKFGTATQTRILIQIVISFNSITVLCSVAQWRRSRYVLTMCGCLSTYAITVRNIGENC